MNNVSSFQAILIGIFYYLAQSPWLFGLGYWTLYRPLVAGLIVGIILGDPIKGTMVGAGINVLYLGFISAGGALPGDPALAGYIGTTLAIAANMDVNAALALAVPIGLLGTIIWFGRMTIDTVFVHWADKYADEGNIRMIALIDMFPPQILLFIISFFPVFFASLYGPGFVQGALQIVGENVLHALMVIGGIMPALGIALNLRAIAKSNTLPYFFLGFLLSVYVNLNVIAVAAICLVLAFIHLQFINPNRGVEIND